MKSQYYVAVERWILRDEDNTDNIIIYLSSRFVVTELFQSLFLFCFLQTFELCR